MKSRIKIDSTILSCIIILTGLLYLFPSLYPADPFVNTLLNFGGVIVILKGTFLRMAARGHKKTYSKEGYGLVMTGPYSLIRNPMYLGSFYLGAGFILLVWPWWTLPIFGTLFYLRFRKQVTEEERHLGEFFGETYKEYCRKVPRVFPSLNGLMTMDFKKSFSCQEAFSTKETRGLWLWPLTAFILEIFQQHAVFGKEDILITLLTFLTAMAVFAVVLFVFYKK